MGVNVDAYMVERKCDIYETLFLTANLINSGSNDEDTYKTRYEYLQFANYACICSVIYADEKVFHQII